MQEVESQQHEEAIPGDLESPAEPAVPVSDKPWFLAARFLFPLSDRSDPNDPNWRHAARWFVFWGIVLGVAYAVIFRGAWRGLGEYHRLRLVPVAVLLCFDVGWFGQRLIAGLARLVETRVHSTGQASTTDLRLLLTVILVILLKYVLLLSMPTGARVWPADWRASLGPLFPAVVYRPLILMPIWGCWSMLLAITIGRLARDASGRLHGLANGVSLRLVVTWWLVCMVITMFYLTGSARHIGYGIAIGVGILVATYLASYFMSRRSRGQTEDTICAAGLAGQMAFLLLYLPIASAIYWY